MAGLAQTVGENVRQIRLATGRSQEAWAAELGVHRTYLSAVERGVKNLTLRSVERLADKIGVPAERLLTEQG
ncbi:MAG: helix-turn-helix domain-containing protein [Acidimicrobiales bacterium]